MALYYRSGGALGMLQGAANTASAEVGAPDTLVLMSVECEPGQRVKANDVLARLDTRIIDAEIAIQKALMAQPLGEEDYVLQMTHQFAAEIAGIEADLASARLEMAQAEAERDVLDREMETLDRLLERRIIQPHDVSPIRARRAALAQAAQGYSNLVAVQESQLADAHQREQALRRWLSPEERFDLAKVVERRVSDKTRVHAATIEMLLATRETYVLRAPRDGVVSRVYYRPGSTVPEGEPIVRVADETPDEITALLRDDQLRLLRVGMKVFARQPGGTRETETVVTSVSPDISALPTRANRIPDPDIIVRGRRATLKIVGETDILPGETVSLRIPVSSVLPFL
ncbi:MAG: HlyD family efflux transporter periplasmic adaptor subunit [Kiritimatiellae bacterium]|nr:HlyD family efflux transporter periplasmic adaptor subunit [Kiritimatiellia bacterium]